MPLDSLEESILDELHFVTSYSDLQHAVSTIPSLDEVIFGLIKKGFVDVFLWHSDRQDFIRLEAPPEFDPSEQRMWIVQHLLRLDSRSEVAFLASKNGLFALHSS